MDASVGSLAITTRHAGECALGSTKSHFLPDRTLCEFRASNLEILCSNSEKLIGQVFEAFEK